MRGGFSLAGSPRPRHALRRTGKSLIIASQTRGAEAGGQGTRLQRSAAQDGRFERAKREARGWAVLSAPVMSEEHGSSQTPFSARRPERVVPSASS